MDFKKKIAKPIPIVIALGLGLAISTTALPATADVQESPYLLSTEVVTLLDNQRTANLNASGEIVDENGKIIGVITAKSPSVTVVRKEHPMAKIINEKPDEVMAASLYNRINFLKDLAASETVKGHVKKDQLPVVMESLEKTRKELDQKIKSNDDFTFKEAIEIGERLDQTARGLKRAKEFRAHAALATPMVVIEPEEPEVKRLTIFFQTTKKPASSASNTNSTF